jgi:hypothetical protein
MWADGDGNLFSGSPWREGIQICRGTYFPTRSSRATCWLRYHNFNITITLYTITAERRDLQLLLKSSTVIAAVITTAGLHWLDTITAHDLGIYYGRYTEYAMYFDRFDWQILRISF